MSDSTNERKLEHLRIINTDAGVDRRAGHFDQIHLRHRALPELNLADVDPGLDFLGKRLRFPLLISSMTGGDHEVVRQINRHLAIAAEHCGVAMGVGSQRVMFDRPEARASFAVREHAPTTVLFANLGAVQLTHGFGPAHCRAAVDAVGADALYLHVNPLQEAVQPEGDTDFAGLAAAIAGVCAELDVPVALKEVGSGISPADAELALQAGVRILDVAGAGGTSWSRIEHHRQQALQPDDDLGLVFQDWGIPTPLALELLAPYTDRATLIASGGVRNGIDMLKAVILGAELCGLASPFLKPAMESPEAVIRVIERLKREFTTGMFLLGAKDLGAIRGHRELILPT